MISRLRRNFILVAMCSMAAVLTVIVGTLNLVSYWNMVDKADMILELLAENDAVFPIMPDNFIGNEMPPDENLNIPPGNNAELSLSGGEINAYKYFDGAASQQKEKPGQRHDFKRLQEMSPETPYETRFFSVKFNANGQITTVDTGKIAAVATEDAVEFAEDILESGRTGGFYDSYRYKVVTQEDSVMMVFVDRSRELASYRTLAVTSVSVSLVGLLAVFILVLIFSKKVFRPVAVSYEKQKQFITDASHELKTPLTIISANVEVLELECDEENTWLNSIKNQIARLSGLVEQMVTLSRMDEANTLQEACDFVIADAVAETAELFVVAAEAKAIQLDIHVEGTQAYHGNEKQIRQMVSLLMDNAVKYTPENGSIKVSLVPKGKHYQLTVQNTAEELPQGNLDILFERFYRLDSSRSSKTGGSGIGLSIVKSIVEAHKGKISATGKDGKSLLIEVIL